MSDADLKRLADELTDLALLRITPRAPLAAVYGDLLRAVADFERRSRDGDPLVAGRRRLLYFDNQGTGPCRQGQYVEVHKLLAQRDRVGPAQPGCAGADPVSLQFLIAGEADGYGFGTEQWVLLRMYLAVIVQAVLQQLHFRGAECGDAAEYERFERDYEALAAAVYRHLESFRGPGRAWRRLLRLTEGSGPLQLALKLFAYRLRDRGLQKLLRDFARRWPRAEYERLVGLGVFQGEALELMGGQLVVAEPQGAYHASAISAAEYALRAVLPSGWIVRTQMPLSLDDESEPEPDLVVVPGRPGDYRVSHPERPVLAVEVAERSLAFDREDKGSLYARARLEDYWIVNLVDRALEVHREPAPDASARYGWRYRSVTVLTPPATIAALAFPSSPIAVADLFP